MSNWRFDHPVASLIRLSQNWLLTIFKPDLRSAAIFFASILFTSSSFAAEEPQVGKAQNCLECHAALSPKSIAAWQQSKHAAKGVGCAECHGNNHSRIFTTQGRVSAAVCGSCHAKEHKEFDQSLHAAAVDKMEEDPKFGRLSPAMAALGCNGCHQIGARFSDGSRGKCNSCHSSHSFSVEEARSPEACAQCHTGPDHAQLAMWQASKHGQLYANKSTREQGPSCITCHMPQGGHNTSVGLTLGHVASGAALEGSSAPIKMRMLSEDEARGQRAKMLQTCLPCHSSRFATDSLLQADQVKREADDLLSKAVKVIRDLESEGLIATGSGSLTNRAQSPPHSLVLGTDQLYDRASTLEQRFFDMFKYHHATTFKGAYHHSPEYTHNEGFLRMKQDLAFLESEAARLRATAPKKKGSQ